jgi:hypothetical protein
MSLNYEMKSNLNDKAVDEFLNSQTKEGTFKSYKTVMKQYLQYTQKTGQELLDIKKADTTFQVENSMLTYRKRLRASDFLSITYGQLRSKKLDGEAPIALGEIATKKERIKAFPFLDSDAIPIVKAWLESHKDAKDSDRILNDTEDNLSVILQTLAKKAGMEVENGAVHNRRIRMHCLRKYTIDRLSAYASESQWKQIVGKSIDEGAYVSQDQLKGVFARAMKDLLINGNGIKAKKLIELENALLESQRKLSAEVIKHKNRRKARHGNSPVI